MMARYVTVCLSDLSLKAENDFRTLLLFGYS